MILKDSSTLQSLLIVDISAVYVSGSSSRPERKDIKKQGKVKKKGDLQATAPSSRDPYMLETFCPSRVSRLFSCMSNPSGRILNAFSPRKVEDCSSPQAECFSGLPDKENIFSIYTCFGNLSELLFRGHNVTLGPEDLRNYILH